MLRQNVKEVKLYNYNIKRELEKSPDTSSYSEDILINIFITSSWKPLWKQFYSNTQSSGSPFHNIRVWISYLQFLLTKETDFYLSFPVIFITSS